MTRGSAVWLVCVMVFAFAAAAPVFAQERVDVVYLKNGSVVRGTIVEQVPNESIKIETADGSVFVFKMSEVEKIVREPASSSRGTGRAVPPMAASYVVVNPLGIVEFGPMVDLELRLSPKLYALAHVRFQGLGLLAHLISSDVIAYWSTAVGTGVRYFFTTPATPNAPYLGAAVEVGYNPYSGDKGYVSAYHGSSVYVTIAANGGYRWRFDNFIVNVGGYLGVAPTVYSQYSYDTAPSVMYDGTLDTTFVAMAEVSVGWALK